MKEIKVGDKVRLKSLEELEECYGYALEIGEFANKVVTIKEYFSDFPSNMYCTSEIRGYAIYQDMIVEIVEDDDCITYEELKKELESFKKDMQKSVAECLHGFRENFNYTMSGGIFGSLPSEKKYYWRLKGFNGDVCYFNLIDLEQITINDKLEFGEYRTQFTEKEFMDLVEEHGFVAEAFEKVEVEK